MQSNEQIKRKRAKAKKLSQGAEGWSLCSQALCLESKASLLNLSKGRGVRQQLKEAYTAFLVRAEKMRMWRKFCFFFSNVKKLYTKHSESHALLMRYFQIILLILSSRWGDLLCQILLAGRNPTQNHSSSKRLLGMVLEHALHATQFLKQEWQLITNTFLPILADHDSPQVSIRLAKVLFLSTVGNLLGKINCV